MITAAIGLLHGLGFSFVLHEMLKVDSPNLWASLISFNVGVEIGQVVLIVAVWPLLILGYRLWPRPTAYGRNTIAAACVAVAAVWTVERIAMLVA